LPPECRPTKLGSLGLTVRNWLYLIHQ